MTAVVLSRKLARDLKTYGGPTFPSHFASEFQLWKDGGIDVGDTFGKNTTFMRPPELVSLKLWKVHLEDSSVTPKWNQMLKRGISNPLKYTSDRELVYVQMGDFRYEPYLLLTILDPAHPFMQDPAKVRTLATAYEIERQAYSRRSPGDAGWVVVGMP